MSQARPARPGNASGDTEPAKPERAGDTALTGSERSGNKAPAKSPEQSKRRGQAAPKAAADPARRLAFDVLREVNGRGAYANLALRQRLGRAGLNGRDAAFVTELTAGTCRAQGLYDQVLERAAGRSLTTLQPAVADLLRLGCHQLLALRLPVPVAVSATVDLAAATVGRRVTGLVNAVLRRVASHGLEDWLDLLCEGLDRLAALACRTAHPKWIAAVYLERLGWEEAAAALQANNRPPETVLAVRPGLASLDELAAQGARPGRWSPYAALADGDPGRFDAVRQGRAGVEDEGSQLVALGFAQAGGAVGGLSTVSPWPGPAERSPAAPPPLWLDLCAGPGGKAALLRGLAAAAGARLIANEAAPTRARLTAQALRAYPGPAAVVAADGRRPPWRPGVFDRVLADVPCTGLGALRRRPEARWRKSAADLPALTALQAGLLESALASCRPGGLVVYATCSPHPAETDALVEKVLARGGAAQVIPAAEVWPDIPDSAFGPYLQLWPHRHGADAMFAAVLRRR